MDARDLQQMHYTAIDDMLDDYSESDRAFMLWDLLQDYIEDIDKEMYSYNENTATVKEYAMYQMFRTHKIVAEQMRDILYYKWS